MKLFHVNDEVFCLGSLQKYSILKASKKPAVCKPGFQDYSVTQNDSRDGRDTSEGLWCLHILCIHVLIRTMGTCCVVAFLEHPCEVGYYIVCIL